MRAPLSWLKEFVDLDGVEVSALVEHLTVSGLEVGAVQRIGEWWDPAKVVTARVTAIAPHPNADRLSLVTVDCGGGKRETVVTGARNVRLGLSVAFAGIGAEVINGHSENRERITLKPAKLRGIDSCGMVLSERELGLSDEHEGIIELPDEVAPGQSLVSVLGDIVIEIDILPSMARCLGIVGLAREIAGLLNRRFASKPGRDRAYFASADSSSVIAAASDQCSVKIFSSDDCPRFSVIVIPGVRVGTSPFAMQQRLRRAGMRPINNVVDITNYVMLETGQPLHAFDYAKLRARADGGPVEISTRRAKPGETLVCLDGVTRTLSDKDIVVADRRGALSLAGVMGGQDTEVGSETECIVLESAAWSATCVRMTSHTHKLFSEAAYRFGRGVSAESVALALREAAGLFTALLASSGQRTQQGASAVAPKGYAGHDVYPGRAAPRVVQTRIGALNRLLGTEFTAEEVANYLCRLDFACGKKDGDILPVTVPAYRLDVVGEADIAEEVLRLYGFSAMPIRRLADELPVPYRDPFGEFCERVRLSMTDLGCAETINYSLVAPEIDTLLAGAFVAVGAPHVGLQNAIAPERSVLRQSLIGTLLEVAARNVYDRGGLALFEVGKTFIVRQAGQSSEAAPDLALPLEPWRLGIVATGVLHESNWCDATPPEWDFFALKGILETLFARLLPGGSALEINFAAHVSPVLQPGRVAAIHFGGKTKIGVIGEVHPQLWPRFDLRRRTVACEIDLEALFALVKAAPRRAQVVSRFPTIREDLAVIVRRDVQASDLVRTICAAGGENLGAVDVFDVYEGKQISPGHKSIAFRLAYQSLERTLTDKDASEIRARIMASLRAGGAEVRGTGA